MKAFFNSALALCLLRRAPQDLPASDTLLWLLVILDLLVGTLIVTDPDFGLLRAFLENLFSVVMSLSLLAAALGMRGKLPRFNQTASAMLLSEVLLSLFALPLVILRNHSESAEAELLLLVIFVWSIVVLGHILRHAFEISLNFGIAFALLYNLMAWSVLSHFFPVTG